MLIIYKKINTVGNVEDRIREDKLKDIPGWLQQHWQEMLADLTRYTLAGVEGCC